jgi:hypothetical protein
MVYLKVSDGSETRKLQVTPGEVTFDQLKEQLATFFPKTLGDASSGLSLQYRDTDGDVITLSSDQELQEALSQLQEDGVWKLYIRNGQRSGQKSSPSPSSAQHRTTQRGNGCEATSLFHRLFEPSVRPFGLFSDVWDDLEQHLQLLHQLHSEVFSSSDAKTEKKNTTENQEKKTSTEVPSKSEGEATGTTEQQAAQDPDETVKSKPQAADSDKKEGSDGSDKSDSQWHTRRFVTWEPRVHVGPFGFFHSHLTPVVYKVSYKSSCSSSDGCGSSSADKGDKSEAGTKTETQEQAASPGAENRVEESAATTTTTENGVPEETPEAATLAAQ